MDDRRTEYWAAKPIAEIAAAIEEQFDAYKKWGATTEYFDRIISSFNAFYGFDSNGTIRVTRTDGDVAEINVNHFKSLIRRLHILVTENKLAFQPRARNSDSKSQVESDLAKGIAEYYADEKRMNDTFSDAVLGALIMLEQYVHAPWDITEGYELTADGQQAIKSGDQLFECFNPFDVAKATTTSTSPWYIIRKKVNKYDEAVLHPEFAVEILASSCEPDQYDLSSRGIEVNMQQMGPDDDMVHKLIMYHARTPSMPEGRHVEVIASQVLSDKPLRYNRMPLFRLSAGDILGTGYGDSPAVDLLPIQQALNAVFSGVVTNNLNNSIQLIYSADPNLIVRTLSDGQRLVSAAAEPKGLNLTGSSAENYKMIDLLVQQQQLLSGVNDVARGNPNASLKSGTSLAVILAQAIQYVSNLQKGYARLAGDVATCLINNIQMFASEEMTAYITGASRKGQIKKFRGKDVMDIERITVDLGNPLTQSYAGRNEMITAWQQYGIIKDPKQIVSFLRTGELDQTTENQFSDSLLIRDENEQLRRGETPVVLLTDNHAEHIIEHKAIMSSPEARADPRIVAAWTAHVQEHMDTMRAVPPDLAAVISGQPLPPPAPPPATPDQPLPTVDGARMPSMPPGMPPQAAENYQQALDAVPEDQGAA
jgi:hypothetical protein